LRAFEAALAAVRRFPTMYPIVRGRARRVTLRRFPYSLVYVPTDDEILLIACMYGGRDPRRWQERL
jgi:hypothetical protein